MAEVVSGVLSFPGIVNPQYATITKRLGIRASQALIYSTPQDTSPDTSGTATFTFGSTSQTLTWTNALCDSGTKQFTTHGHIQIFVIQDKRWRWAKGTPVTGSYNVRKPDGTIDAATQKTLAELATILFTAFGEASANVAAITSTEYPELIWDRDNPADELEELLGQRGYVISLLTDNTAKVYERGTGATLPVNDDLISASMSIDPPEIPEKLRLICGVTLVQSMLKFVAVGLDTDGKSKLIKDLSYNPGGVGNASGWDGMDLETFAYITDQQALELAIQTVGKWFQVDSQADGTQDISFDSINYVPGEITVNDASQLLPLQPFILDTATDPFGKKRYQEAFVSGTFWIAPSTAAANQPPSIPGNTPDFTRIDRRDWDLNGEYGILMFKEPAVKDVAGVKKMADVYLTCCYAVNPDGAFQVKDKYQRDRALGGYGIDAVKIDELQRTLTVAYTAGTSTVSGITDNKSTVDTNADLYLDQAQKKYVTTAANLLLYRNNWNFDTDGVCWQIQWDVAVPGAVPFSTRCSQFAEMIPVLPTQYQEDQARTVRRQGSITNQRNKSSSRLMYGKFAPGGGMLGFN